MYSNDTETANRNTIFQHSSIYISKYISKHGVRVLISLPKPVSDIDIYENRGTPEPSQKLRFRCRCQIEYFYIDLAIIFFQYCYSFAV